MLQTSASPRRARSWYPSGVGQERIIVQRCFLPGLDATQAASALTFARHTHDQFGIGVIRAGAHRSASGRGPVEAIAGDVITVNPGEVHDGAPLGGPRKWRMLYLDPDLVMRAAAEAGLSDAGMVAIARPVIRDAAFATLVLRAHAFATDPRADGLARETALADLLATTLRRHVALRSRPALRASIARARQRIDDDPAASTTLAELAAEVDLSRFQLVHGFRRETGLPPHAYRVVQRVLRARGLIRAGLPLAEVAAALGFADQSHMNRAFVRVTGATPGAWAAASG
jgi:AraC-like DNA-binding protein